MDVGVSVGNWMGRDGVIDLSDTDGGEGGVASSQKEDVTEYLSF